MLNRKIIIIVMIIAIALIGTGVVMNMNYTSNETTKEETSNYEEPETKEKTLPMITTEDKKITIKETKAYNRDGISEMMITIITTEQYPELYLGITFNFETEKETSVIKFENVTAQKEYTYLLQSYKDWTTVKTWSVKQLTYDEAIAEGYNKID